MATVAEQSIFENTVYEIETTDPVEGGPNGAFNRGIQGLANRTRYLYDRLISAGLNGAASEYSGNLNDLRTTGAFLALQAATNRPAGTWGHVQVIAAAEPDAAAAPGSDSAMQFYFSPEGHYVRQYAGSWSEWERMETTSTVEGRNYAPVGSVMYYAGATAPQGWIFCQGQQLSVAAYPELYAAFGSPGSPGATTFTIPDCRGEFLRGLDASRGVDSGRVIRSSQSEETKAHAHTATTLTPTVIPVAPTHQVLTSGSATPTGATTDLFTLQGVGTTSSGGAETRPRNVAFNVIIRY